MLARRDRESRDDDGDNINGVGVKKIKAIKVIRQMGIRQLREQAIVSGISPNGSKRELLDRLYTAESVEESKELARVHGGLYRPVQFKSLIHVSFSNLV